MISFMTETIMKTLWIILSQLVLLLIFLIFKYPASDILSHKPRTWKPRNIQLEFVENEHMTEIHILMTEFNPSFTSLITVEYYLGTTLCTHPGNGSFNSPP